ncbi:MAG: MFS transporter, partial [Gammaproteobacteria bacterium]
MNPSERRAVVVIAGLYAMRMIGLFMVLPVFMVLGQSLEGATPALLGMAIGAYGLTQAVLQIPFGVMSDRLGRKPVIVAGLLLFAAGSLLAAVSDSVWGVIAGRFLQGAGAIASALMALLADVTREEQRTRGMAIVGMTIGLSFIVALLIGPVVAEWVGLSGLFGLTAVMALGGLVLLAVIPTPRRQTLNRDTSVDTARFADVLRHSDLLRLNWGIFSLHLILTSLFVVLPKLLVEVHGIEVAHHGWLY